MTGSGLHRLPAPAPASYLAVLEHDRLLYAADVNGSSREEECICPIESHAPSSVSSFWIDGPTEVDI